MSLLERLMPLKRAVVIVYVVVVVSLAVLLLMTIGRDVLPRVNSGQFQVRLRTVEGTRVERTEAKLIQALGILEEMVGKENISVTSAFIGQHPTLFSTSPIYLFMGGPHESLLQVSLNRDYDVDLNELREQFRAKMKERMPDMKVSFEPIELTDKILSQGSPTPIEVRIASRNKKLNEEYANKVIEKLKEIPYMRDVQLAQSIKYPALNINIDRLRAAQLGVDMNDISRSLVTSTSSSRYTEKNVWLDEAAGLSYGVQVQVPENKMSSIEDLGEIPILKKHDQANPQRRGYFSI